jgi:uncharacterized protein (DUF1684 family)
MGAPGDGAAPGDYAAEVAAWDADRDRRLRSPNGWLALVGLHWLTDGTHAVGSDASNPIHLTGRDVPADAGVLEVTDGAATWRPGNGAALALTDDRDGAPTLVDIGALRFHLIRRGERLGLRVRDTEAPILRTFGGVPRFPVDPAWRITGRLERPLGLRIVEVPDILGDVREEESAGIVRFAVAGEEAVLEALPEDEGRLWLIFGDLTNGSETYSGGRFLVSGPVAEDGSVLVDFNLAYNPPCVFSPYATCPLPWPANQLPFPVTAGERLPDR